MQLSVLYACERLVSPVELGFDIVAHSERAVGRVEHIAHGPALRWRPRPVVPVAVVRATRTHDALLSLLSDALDERRRYI